jgi:hypothetical protein
MSPVERQEETPLDRLTRICDVMTFALENHSEATGMEKAIVMLTDGKQAGIVIHGYDNDGEAIAAMIFHLQAISRRTASSSTSPRWVKDDRQRPPADSQGAGGLPSLRRGQRLLGHAEAR